ncbi:MAG: cupin domain-containing protein [Phycisphaerae bacterium]|nr:cupin domain-containing protein [Phycisphaerae bacterium]
MLNCRFESVEGLCGLEVNEFACPMSFVFDVGRKALREVRLELNACRVTQPVALRARLLNCTFASLAAGFARYPIELRSPFEGASSVAGAVWPGAELRNEDRDDGLAKLRFDRGACELPMHAHEYSDRFIVVLSGAGLYHFSAESLSDFTGRDVRSASVTKGDVVCFTRGLVHTFSAPDQELVLLSYHAPLIAFDDPRQYSLPAVRWTYEEHAQASNVLHS